MQVAEYTIHDSHRWEELTPSEILAYSSNIGTAKIGAALGRPGLFRALRRFGFGARTEVDLPAEADGILRHYKRWYDMDAATVSFGQGMSVTSLQLASAMGAIANGGRLMKPLLVSRVTDAQGATIEEITPSVRRQVVPSHVARLVGDMLTRVTGPGGTGEAAAMDGYVVAGKTGTAQRADYARGGYAKDAWTATFVGFVPANRPRLVISVVIDEPVIDHYGGTVAGPAFRRIAADSLRHLGVAPSQGGTQLAELVKGLRAEQREIKAQAEVVEAPKEGAELVASAGKGAALAPGQVEVPRLKGLGARAALIALRAQGLEASLAGSGVVTEQVPEPGAVVARGGSVQVTLRNPSQDKDGTRDNSAVQGSTLAAVDVEAMP
jgi:cell division protein FtsI (penicillin-binding protein 3)